jgi:glucose-1-phosphate cytidylyltransferase
MASPHETPVAILCGGRGTRLQEQTHAIPKALVEIGGRPIVWHVIQLYLTQGFREVLLLTGYLGDQVEAFVAAEDWPAGASVTCVETGGATPTGGRVARAAEHLRGGTCCVTYADGVADIDLAALLAGHAAAGLAATMTVVRPELQFGVAELAADGRITGFREKPRSQDWVNGGFLCLEPGALERIGPDDVLEQGPLTGLAADGQLRAHLHEGFWDCMDTYKDAVLLNDLCERGEAPWRRW